MQAKPVQIIAPQALTSSAAMLYQSPSGKQTIISKITFGNSATAAAEVTVYLVPNGKSQDDSTRVVPARLLDANESWSAYSMEGLTMKAGDQLYMNTDATGNGKVSVSASGVEIF